MYIVQPKVMILPACCLSVRIKITARTVRIKVKNKNKRKELIWHC